MKIAGKDINMGIMYRREHAPEQLPAFARHTEAAGYDELWVVEDCFFGSGIASASTALAVTNHMTIGIGIMPAVVRNPVYAAMELANLARMYPGRVLPGFGHGVESWMRQAGAFPGSQLAALGETVEVIKHLLGGEFVNFQGREVHVSDAKLNFPPDPVPPILLGVRGPKSLQMAGRVGDGTILSEFASPEYVRWAREQIAKGQTDASKHHRLTVFAMAYFNEDAAKAHQDARARVVSAIYNDGIDLQLEPMGILPQAVEMRRRNAVNDELPDAWVSQLTIVGTPEACKQTLLEYIDAGVDTIVLVPPPEESLAAPDEISARLINYLK